MEIKKWRLFVTPQCSIDIKCLCKNHLLSALVYRWFYVNREDWNFKFPETCLIFKKKTETNFWHDICKCSKVILSEKFRNFDFFHKGHKGHFNYFLTGKFQLFCIANYMEKGLQIRCRVIIRFCEYVANILDTWSWHCRFESLNLRYAHRKKFGQGLKIFIFLVPFNPFLKAGKCGEWSMYWNKSKNCC